MFNWFKKKAEKKEINIISLVWNEDGVKLDTNAQNGIYEFNDFTGYIKLFDEKCQVKNATFIYKIGNINSITSAFPVRAIDVNRNVIKEFQGTVVDGVLRCEIFKNSVMDGGTVYCKRADNNTINNGVFSCTEWLKGTVNGGLICCDEWKCGTFNDGTFKGEWHQGIFNGGTFKGEWYGGKWKGGDCQGDVYVGDGTVKSLID